MGGRKNGRGGGGREFWWSLKWDRKGWGIRN